MGRLMLALLLASAAALANPVLADDTRDSTVVSQVAAQLGRARGVRARFTQTQTLRSMQRPLVSAGTLLFSRERGVIWQIEQPLRLTYVVTEAGVRTLDAAGKPVPGSQRNAAGIAQVSRMMRAMLGGDLSAMYSQFDVAAQGTPAHWRLRLTPTQPQLAQALRGLDLHGDTYVRGITIRAVSGDETRLEFTDSASVDTLSPAELALLGAS
ncbi:outer membrane lipoprotein carrier protein LolA [Ralstonia nicotianae]|uniref:outer membrane lipoprotein carrier protein LolA n=1 Tax=Ralstonia pseudosolanacearum TaxID=1310165 RepID=UPI0007C8CE44|nr:MULTISPECIES: outer membrane lipoprotein carrier protein LolA [Ralstonia]AXV71396.1 outer membrane lipoprotein carrier protein LolA [Ralstonia solanacearum]AXV97902.1 outer membrane lipoprotein carrier protein LolA [Ralstonia solanacearum]AXW03077.1 outer membrane lipoprotein carrier protein LolA [Ralstonia solanacearum]AXW12544.1 outer membrane lipoprotein carrier protein LolA [Ralstonia solanacearum]AXW30565.1 outer membrane lipoprotein carrier protein LolA [Ralstonia solanacearum]